MPSNFLEIIINVIVTMYTQDFEELFKCIEEVNILKHYAILPDDMQTSNVTKVIKKTETTKVKYLQSD